jgi:catechol 2,3-dioxygenase-like lactoylglutathione lyase family enzyme
VAEAGPEVQHAHRTADPRRAQQRLRRPRNGARLPVEPRDLRVVASEDVCGPLAHRCLSLSRRAILARRGCGCNPTTTGRSAMWQRSTAMLDIERVDFVSVPTRDVARARRFYADVLGLSSSAVNPAEFETPNLTLALWQPEAEGVPFVPNTAGIALRVHDVEAARERLSERGVEFLGDTIDTGVCLMGFFYDPDGNLLILHRRYAPRVAEDRAQQPKH